VQAAVSCIGLSKVGDTALDLPEANVIIQVSSQFGARRQEAQRLGRILRPKPNPTGGYNAFFYSLVSTDTREMFFSTKRQQYLVDQGYTFKVVQDLCDRADKESSLLKTTTQEMDLLGKILSFTCDELDREEDQAIAASRGEDEGDTAAGGGGAGRSGAQRRSSTLSAISGGDGTLYAEYDSRR
jgi:DNA excision repair protein ERCC-3